MRIVKKKSINLPKPNIAEILTDGIGRCSKQLENRIPIISAIEHQH